MIIKINKLKNGCQKNSDQKSKPTRLMGKPMVISNKVKMKRIKL